MVAELGAGSREPGAVENGYLVMGKGKWFIEVELDLPARLLACLPISIPLPAPCSLLTDINNSVGFLP